MSTRASTLEFTVVYITEDCCVCGLSFALTEEFKKERQRDKKLFYCPNGHSQSYMGETHEAKVKRLQREAEAERENAANAWKRYDELDKRLKATKRQQAAEARRAAAALCPVPGCHRQIVQMKRHLATKHPDFHGAH